MLSRMLIEQIAIHVPLICGAFISFSLMKVPDLSIESAYLFGGLLGSIVALTSLSSSPFVLLGSASLAAIAGGMLVGSTAALLSSKLRIPHLLAAIITVGLFHGIFQLCSSPYISLRYSLYATMLDKPIHIIVLIGISMLCLGGLSFLLRTQLGYSVAAYGNNPNFFDYFRSNRSYIFISGIVVSNGLAGLSGYLFAQSALFVEMNMGLGRSLFCITVLILGKTVSRMNPRSSLIPLQGLILYTIMQATLLKIGFNVKYFTMVQAGLILLIIAYRQRHVVRNMNDQLGV